MIMFMLKGACTIFPAKGVANRGSAGHIASIAESAARLNPNLPSPVISIETEGGYVCSFLYVQSIHILQYRQKKTFLQNSNLT